MTPPRRTLRGLVIDGIVVGAILLGLVTLVERWSADRPHLNELRSIYAPTKGKPN